MRQPGQPVDGAPATAAVDPAAVIGDYVIVESLRIDRIGEVCRAEGPAGIVRIRIVRTDDVRRLATRLVRLESVHSPHLAPVFDRLADSQGRIAVVGPLERVTLAARRRRGVLTPETVAALGPPLLDALADLHAAELVHGSVFASCVGIDDSGRPHWLDACLRAPEGSGAPGRNDDLVRCAAMLRDLGRLPAPLHEVVDAVASGRPGAVTSAAELARRWRRVAVDAGIAVPPQGSVAELADLLAPAPRTRRRPRRLRVPRRLRPAGAVIAAVVALGVVPGARVVPGGAAPLLGAAQYLPAHKGQTLVYHYDQTTDLGNHSGTVTMNVSDAGVVAGVLSVSLAPAAADATAAAALPFGLAGTTLRVQGGAVNRAVSGGLVRDLVEPLRPGTTWADVRTPLSGFTATERRTVLGPTGLDLGGGHLDRCVAVRVDASSTTSAGVAGQHATGVVWFCDGVGLARAVLTGDTEHDEIDLVSW